MAFFRIWLFVFHQAVGSPPISWIHHDSMNVRLGGIRNTSLLLPPSDLNLSLTSFGKHTYTSLIINPMQY